MNNNKRGYNISISRLRMWRRILYLSSRLLKRGNAERLELNTINSLQERLSERLRSIGTASSFGLAALGGPPPSSRGAPFFSSAASAASAMASACSIILSSMSPSTTKIGSTMKSMKPATKETVINYTCMRTGDKLNSIHRASKGSVT